MAKRKVEVFTASCPVCDPTIELVQRIACPDCEVTVLDTREPGGTERAQEYGIKRVPTVVINGEICSCCVDLGPNETDLRAGGIGLPVA